MRGELVCRSQFTRGRGWEQRRRQDFVSGECQSRALRLFQATGARVALHYKNYYGIRHLFSPSQLVQKLAILVYGRGSTIYNLQKIEPGGSGRARHYTDKGRSSHYHCRTSSWQR